MLRLMRHNQLLSILLVAEVKLDFIAESCVLCCVFCVVLHCAYHIQMETARGGKFAVKFLYQNKIKCKSATHMTHVYARRAYETSQSDLGGVRVWWECESCCTKSGSTTTSVSVSSEGYMILLSMPGPPWGLAPAIGLAPVTA
jgi:hypothetical protein